MPTVPTLHLIAGVNGSGKTTFYRFFLQLLTPGAEFVNADEIAHERWPGSEATHNPEAARLAIERRSELMSARLSFVTETVFSHRSKLDLVKEAKQSGYRVILYHVGVDSSDLAAARVATRVEAGGHDVPPEKIAARYSRTQNLIPQAAEIADITMVFDNSGRSGTATHTFVLRLAEGRLVSRTHGMMPLWVREAYARFLVDRD